jgi:tRNA-specific 2-thiouridylase
VQVRHRARAVAGKVVATGATIELELAAPQRAITPGQSGVLYRGDVVVGGGRIR